MRLGGRGLRYIKQYGLARLYRKIMERRRRNAAEAGYNDWLLKQLPDAEEDARQREKRFAYEPCISILVPAYETPENFLRQMIDSVLEQSYGNLELCIADGSPSDKVEQTVKEYEKIKPVFFGMSNECQVYGDKIVSRGLKGMTCTIHLGDTAFTVDIPMPGRHMVYNALAAAAVGNIYGLTTEQIKAGIESLEPISGRFRMIETDKFLIVDDCYNANPMSMKASLDVLQDGAGRRIAVLGDMGELGENEVQLHEEVGEHAGKCDIDVLICTGKLCRNMAERAQRTNPDLKVIYEPDRESLLEHLEGYVQDGDTILVKASHFMKFEEVVTKLENM